MFQSHTNNGITFFESSLLRQTGRLTHGFSTRLGGCSEFPYDSLNLGFHTQDDSRRVQANRERFAQAFALEPSRIATVRFVHGDHIVDVDADGPAAGYIDPQADLVEADGMTTARKGQALFISYSDCAPLLFYDPEHHALAAVHAGWRGTLASLPAKTVRVLHDRYGTDPAKVRVAVGPMIGQKTFEVGPELREAFEARSPRGEDLFLPASGDRSYLDLATAIRWQLLEAGVLPAHLDICPFKTADQPELFYSYRRDGAKNFGVMGALVALV